MIFLLFLVSTVFANSCEPGWTPFQGSCYKHIVRDTNDRRTFDGAIADCAAHGSYLSPAASPAEMDFLTELGSRPGNWSVNVDALKAFAPSSSLIGGGYYYLDYMLLGAKRPDGVRRYHWLNSSSTWFGQWCQTPGKPSEPTYGLNYCVAIQFSPPCIWDIQCDNYYKPYGINTNIVGFLHYTCKKQAIPCKEDAEVKADGSCGCKQGFLDITDLQVPEGKHYKKGEKCIPRNPCHNLTKGDLSIVFVVDSSQSIGASNWQNMVTFLKSGSRLLDNSINVGFVKFSTEVTYSEWLPMQWTKNEYLDDVPSSFDAGYTNTPAGLDAARKLFDKIHCPNKVAVLITDGMPFVEDILPKDLALEKTAESAKQLRRDRISLVALGYGKELREYSSNLKDLLPNPKTDYFQYDGDACDFKETHMSFLLNKVCERFK